MSILQNPLQGMSGGNILSKLRRTWIVVYGAHAPQPEIDNANAIAQYMRRSKFNLSKSMPDEAFLGITPGSFGGWFTTGITGSIGGQLGGLGGNLGGQFKGFGALGGGSGPMLNKLGVNLIIVGGPAANELAFTLNDSLEPKWKITVLLTRKTDEKWGEYVTRGGIRVDGLIVDGTLHIFPAAPDDKWGFLMAGTQPTTRLRPLQITGIEGIHFEDTCTMTKALLAGEQGPNVYRDTWTAQAIPPIACPADCTYIKASLP